MYSLVRTAGTGNHIRGVCILHRKKKTACATQEEKTDTRIEKKVKKYQKRNAGVKGNKILNKH